MGIANRGQSGGGEGMSLEEVVLEEENQSQEIEFGLDALFTDELPQKILNTMNGAWEIEDVSSMRILFPDHKEDLFDENFETWYSKTVDKMLKTGNFGELLKLADMTLGVKIAFSKEFEELGRSEETFIKMVESLRGDPNDELSSRDELQYQGMTSAKLLYPNNEYIKNLQLSDLEKEALLNKFSESFRDDKVDYSKTLLYAYRLAIISPKDRKLLDFGEHWAKMEEIVRSKMKSTSSWVNLSQGLVMAKMMKFIAAKEIKITNKRIELVMGGKEDFAQTMPPRPERVNS